MTAAPTTTDLGSLVCEFRAACRQQVEHEHQVLRDPHPAGSWFADRDHALQHMYERECRRLAELTAVAWYMTPDAYLAEELAFQREKLGAQR